MTYLKRFFQFLYLNKWLVLVAVALFCFLYWSEIKPANIRKECSRYLNEIVYERCLHENGL